MNTISSSPTPALRVRQIAESDLAKVSILLGNGFQRPSQYYLQAFHRLSQHPTPAGYPRYGFLMEADDVPVGAVILIFSEIRTDGSSTIRCNVTSWYVEPAYKSYAALLTSRALRHKDVTYINVSARPLARPIVKAQGFETYSSGQYVAIPVLHPRSERIAVAGIDRLPDVQFDVADWEVLSAHAGYGCLSLWCKTGERAYPFVFLPRRLKRLLPGAQLIYCRNINDFVRFSGPLGHFLAMRGLPIVTIDSNGPIPGLIGKYFAGKSPRFFKGSTSPRLGDLAYTQAAMFPWPV